MVGFSEKVSTSVLKWNFSRVVDEASDSRICLYKFYAMEDFAIKFQKCGEVEENSRLKLDVPLTIPFSRTVRA